jgi:chemotaxis receptor (MCP) glutamine deamidase CheD
MDTEGFAAACAGFTIVIVVLSIVGVTFTPMGLLSMFAGSCVGVLLYFIVNKS